MMQSKRGTFIWSLCPRDPNELKRTATHISWFPDGPKKLAIAYCNLDFQGSEPDTGMESFIWDVGQSFFFFFLFTSDLQSSFRL